MRKILLSLLILSLPAFVFSQSFKGSVIEEETNTKMANALVVIEGANLSQTTNMEGEFVFNNRIPSGEHVISISKDGYEVKYSLINVVEGNTFSLPAPIEIVLTKDEKKRRKRIAKELRKEEENREKEREDKINEARKEKEKRDKRLAKEAKKLRKKNKDVIPETENPAVVINQPPPPKNTPVSYETEIHPIQVKYGNLLGITPQEITNIPLYEFIDEWLGTPYKMGGENKTGIDCSSFAQRLYTQIGWPYIERTAQKQWDSDLIKLFATNLEPEEGDLLFFNYTADEFEPITHVGIYLKNNMFVNATSYGGSQGQSGVRIDDLSNSYWSKMYIAHGRRTDKK